jgi:hypothetical protein
MKRAAVDVIALDPADRARRERAREVAEWNAAVEAKRKPRRDRGARRGPR